MYVGVSGDKQLLKVGIVLPATQWLSKKREYLKTISNSLQDLDQVLSNKIGDRDVQLVMFQDTKVGLNEKYNFISKIAKLDSEEDSVNFDEIVAVSPPPNSK